MSCVPDNVQAQETATVERDMNYNDYDFVDLQDASTTTDATSINTKDEILTGIS